MQDQDYPDSYNGGGSSSGRRGKARDHHDDTSNSIVSTDGVGGGSSDATSSTKRSSRSGGKRSTSDRHRTYEQSNDPLNDNREGEPYRIDNLSSDRVDDAEQDVDIPDQGFAPPPPRISNEKNTTLPEKFLSSPTMEQLGLDEEDTRKFMQAFKAYNKLMAKEHMKQTNGDDQDALLPPMDDEKYDPQQEEEQPSKEEDDPSLPQQQSDDGSHKLIENNVKYDQKPSKPTLKDLVGKKVDKEGNVVDDEGKVLGKVSRDMSYLDGKTVNENGDIVDPSGNVYGKAEPVDPPPASTANNKKSGSSLAVRNGDEDVIVNVDAHKGGISFSIHIPRAK